MTKNILLFIDHLGPGGAQRQITNLAIGLKAEGHSVIVATYHDEQHFKPDLDAHEIPQARLTKAHRFSLGPVWGLLNIIKGKKIDVVISFLETPCFYAELAKLFRPSFFLVVSERFTYTHDRLPWSQWIGQMMHFFADKVTTNSHHQRLKMAHHFPWMEERLCTIYNGYDLQKFKPSGIYVDRHCDVEPVRLLAVSRLLDKKNSLNLAKAFRLCALEKDIEIVIDWVGLVEDHDSLGPLSQETLAFLEENQLSDKFRFLGVQSDIHELMRNYDALVHPSFFEGLPNAICEALACGMPVLASDVGDHSILVDEPHGGFLFDPSGPHEIAEKICAFSKLTCAEKNSIGKRNRDFAEENVSLERLVGNYVDLLTLSPPSS